MDKPEFNGKVWGLSPAKYKAMQDRIRVLISQKRSDKYIRKIIKKEFKIILQSSNAKTTK